MESIVTENLVSFKELEKKIFQYVCELGRENAGLFQIAVFQAESLHEHGLISVLV